MAMPEIPLTATNEADHGDELVKPIQPYQARKEYICPGCESIIDIGVGHVVVVPTETPDLRRHWHRGCWYKEQRRRGLTAPRSTSES
jgi:hypothetical protein